MAADPVLLVDKLALRRGGRELCRGLDFQLEAGSSGLIVGANGSGKTSLALALAGLLKPAAGRIQRPARIGYAPQEPRLPERSAVRRYLLELAALSGAGSSAAAWAERSLARFGLLPHARRPIGELSRGWRQRLNLARAWLGEPPLLILDEPQTALDPEGMEILQSLISEDLPSAALILAPAGTGCERLAPERMRLEAVSA